MGEFQIYQGWISPTQIEERLEVTLRWMWKNDFFLCEFRFLPAKLQLLLQMMFSQLGNLPKALQAEVSETLIQTQVFLALKLLT